MRGARLILFLTTAIVVSASAAPLTGPAAVKHLKETGQFNSLGAALAAARYEVRWADGPGMKAQAQNSAQGIRSTFTPDGLDFEFSLGKATHKVSWRLESIGCDSAQTPVPSGALSVLGQRVELRRESLNLTEWFHNRPGGLEHGFTLNNRMSTRRESESLQLVLAVGGDLKPYMDGSGQRLLLRNSDGKTVLTYEKLKVWDATGAEMPAAMRVRDHQVILTVNDTTAEYPLTIDPTFVQQAYLKASNPDTYDFFGCSVAISGNTVVVGAYGEASNSPGVNSDSANNSRPSAGAAYVFVRNGNEWSQQAYLKSGNPINWDDYFGWSVAISGDTVVVGAYADDSNASFVNGNWAYDKGAAYVFLRNGTTWTQQAALSAHNGDQSHRFGWSVAVSGDTIVVGADQESSNARGINGDGFNQDATYSGAAYVFVRNGNTWTQQAFLKASNTDPSNRFGESVSISGDTVVVGSPYEDSDARGVNGNDSNKNGRLSGAAYVFVRNGGTWMQQAYLKASNTGSAIDFGYYGDLFGRSVAVSGDIVIVGATGEDSSSFGVSSPVNGRQRDNEAQDSGAAYVFVRHGTEWTQEAYLKASDTASLAQFGWSVAASSGTVVVGARSETAYVFVRSGTNWSQQAYLKASNPDAGDSFSLAVAIDGRTLVVGAPDEDSGAAGVNGNQGNALISSGAAYVFDLPPGPEIVVEQPLYSNLETGESRNFRNVPVGRDATLTFTIRNTGDADLSNVGVTVDGPDAAMFTVVAAPASTVVPGGAVGVTLRFAPTSIGAKSAIVRIASNDSNESAFNIPVMGTCVSLSAFVQQAYVKAGNTAPMDYFGSVVAISGNTMVVGSPNESSSATGVDGNPYDSRGYTAGAAYVFVREGEVWTQQAYLKASLDPLDGSRPYTFGRSVGISGDTIAVGTQNSSGAAPEGRNNGAAYVFVRSGNTWRQEGYLKAGNRTENDRFGWSVAISGDTVVVGAPDEDSMATGVNGDESDNSLLDPGAAYVFVRVGTNWIQQAFLKASNPGHYHNFGHSVSISGDTILVGAPNEGANFSQTGAAYVFVRNGITWTQQAFLKASNPGSYSQFGFSTAVSGEIAAIAALDQRTVFVFARAGGVWSQQALVSMPGSYLFGYCMALSTNRLVVGGGDTAVPSPGVAYVFKRQDNIWSLETKLVADNPETYDHFADAVAISGSTVVVGARYEDSGAIGINGNATDNSALSAGATYVFEYLTLRPTLTWTNATDIAYGTPLGNAQLNATADVPGAFVYTPPAGTLLNVGSGQILSVTFTPADIDNYSVVTSNVLINVLKAEQTITFPPLSNQSSTAAPFDLFASASSRLPVSFEVLSGPATVDGKRLTITSAGSIIVRATQAGNGNYNPAPAIEQTFAAYHAPVLTVSANQTIGERGWITVTNTAADADVSTNVLTFGLVSAPAGVKLNPLTGVLTWAPAMGQSASTNLITVKVTDDGTPNLSATNSFTVTVTNAPVDWPVLGIEMAASGLSFPTHVAHAGDGSGRIFVTQKNGIIRSVGDTGLVAAPFLSITSRVVSDATEQGMFSMAFSPGFRTNGSFYVFYTRTNDGADVISRFHMSSDTNVADSASEEFIMVIPQPTTVHHGGQLAFGPDGYLYIGVGDGGPGGDPENRAQNLGGLYGKILRLDVESGVVPYAIPPNNPFVTNSAARPEIWAYGLRNPWRFSFDRLTGDLYIADVGEQMWEEVDFQPAGSPGGQNYGWRIREGPQDYLVPAGGVPAGVVDPIWQYSHLESDIPGYVIVNPQPRAIVGGYFCRSVLDPRMQGLYLFADYSLGSVYAVGREGTNWVRRVLVNIGGVSFGEDENGRMYFAVSGAVYRLTDSKMALVPIPITVSGQPLFSGPGYFANDLEITFTNVSPGATLRFSTDGHMPTIADPMVPASGRLVINTSGNYKFRAFRDDLLPSYDLNVHGSQFAFKAFTASIVPPPAPISTSTWVTLTPTTLGARFRYTLDGSTPGPGSPITTDPILVAPGSVLTYQPIRDGYIDGDVGMAVYNRIAWENTIVTTFAGDGSPGNVDGTGTEARFNWPRGLTMHPDGRLIVADYSNNVLRAISPLGVVARLPASGIPPVLPGNIAASQNGGIYRNTGGNPNVLYYQDPTGVGSVYTSTFLQVGSLAMGSDGYVRFGGSGGIIRATPTGIVREWIADLTDQPIAYLGNRLLFTMRNTGCLFEFIGPAHQLWSGTGQGYNDGPAASVKYQNPVAMTADLLGNLYVAESNSIRKVRPDGTVVTLAGFPAAGAQDGPGAQARFSTIAGIAVDTNGAVYVSEPARHLIRKITPVLSRLADYRVDPQTPLAVNLANPAVTPLPGTHSFALVSGPAGVTIDPSTGALAWTPSGEQSASTNTIVVKVVDNGTPSVSATNSFVVAVRAGQSLSFPEIGPRKVSDPPLALSATASSELPVHYSVVSGPATFSQNLLSLDGLEGQVVVRVTQGGDDNYGSAPPVERSFTVFAPPVMTLHPQSQMVLIGTNVVLEVAYSGTPPLAARWYFRDGLVGEGPTNLVLAGVTLNQSGFYSVVVTNYGGAVTSQPAQLTVASSLFLPPESRPASAIEENGFAVDLLLEVGRSFRVQVSSDLQTWTDLTNFTSSGTAFQFLDRTATNKAQRYYRVVSP